MDVSKESLKIGDGEAFDMDKKLSRNACSTYCTVDNFTRGYPLWLTPTWITRRVRGSFSQVDSGYLHVK